MYLKITRFLTLNTYFFIFFNFLLITCIHSYILFDHLFSNNTRLLSYVSSLIFPSTNFPFNNTSSVSNHSSQSLPTSPSPSGTIFFTSSSFVSKCKSKLFTLHRLWTPILSLVVPSVEDVSCTCFLSWVPGTQILFCFVFCFLFCYYI